MVGDAEKIVKAVEGVSGPVDIPTVIAAILIAICLILFLYKTVWPMLKKYFDGREQRREEANEHRRKIEEMAANQEKNEQRMAEMSEMVRKMADSTERLCGQVQDISGGYKITISVLLDIINCMDGSTSPENCAKEAKEKVNAYFREGKLPPLVD